MNLLDTGSVFRGTYTVLEKRGEGAFGEVYLVRHRFMGLQAMKVFKSPFGADEGEVFREAFLLSRVGHPNVIRVFDANIVETDRGERAYITMEYTPGGTLAEYLFQHPPLNVADAVRLQFQICSGLASAHAQNPPIVHRDLKPQNIVLESDAEPARPGNLKVSDWGLARHLDPVIRLASAAGTLIYLPPEGFLHYEVPASDVYAAGLIFYQILTGQFPFPPIPSGPIEEMRLGLARSRSELPPPPSHFRARVPAELDRICLRALEPTISRRFPSAKEFLAALLGSGYAGPQVEVSTRGA